VRFLFLAIPSLLWITLPSYPQVFGSYPQVFMTYPQVSCPATVQVVKWWFNELGQGKR
jgi:hypothetical protein